MSKEFPEDGFYFPRKVEEKSSVESEMGEGKVSCNF
jgi:hypothetical protein